MGSIWILEIGGSGDTSRGIQNKRQRGRYRGCMKMRDHTMTQSYLELEAFAIALIIECETS